MNLNVNRSGFYQLSVEKNNKDTKIKKLFITQLLLFSFCKKILTKKVQETIIFFFSKRGDVAIVSLCMKASNRYIYIKVLYMY